MAGWGREDGRRARDAKRVRKLGSRAEECRGSRSDTIIRSGGKGRFVRDSRSRDVTSRSGTPHVHSHLLSLSLFCCSTPVDRRIKEDAPVETVRDLKRRPRTPRNVYQAAREKKREEVEEEGTRTEAANSRQARVFGEDTPPVYTANVGSNSSWLVATKSIPDSPPLSFAVHRSITRAQQ